MEFDEMPLSARIEGIMQFFDKSTSLLDVSITIGQQNLSSTCAVSIADPEGAISDKLITHSLVNGGIPILRDPSQSQPIATSQGSSVGSSATGGSRVADTSLPPNRAAFLDMIAWAEGTAGENGYRTTFGGGLFNSYKDHPDLTGELKYGGVSNASGRYQFMAIDPPTWENCKRALSLSDFSPINQDKAAVYLLQQRNALGDVDAGRVEAALDKVSYEWASLPPYRYPGQGTKTTAECVAYYNDRLKLYQGGSITPTQKSDLKQAPSTPTTGSNETEPVKGNRLIIQWGDSMFEFFHQSTDYDFNAGRTTLSGVGIRWILNRRPRNKTFQGKTFRQIAEQVAKNQGLKLDYQATYDVYYEFVSQDGISDYQLLKREAERAGLVLSETSTTLVVKSLQNLQDTTLVLEYRQNVISLVTKDQAVDSTSQDFGTWTAQTVGSKVDIDAITGKMVQSKPDIDPTKSKDVTGAAAKQPTGKLQAGTEQAIDKAQAKWKRVRGLPTVVVIPLSNESLSIQPMQAVRTRGFTPFLNRVWVVDKVDHSYSAATTTLQLYTAVSVKDESMSLSTGMPVGNVPSLNGWQMPLGAGFEVSSVVGDPRPYGKHSGTDFATPIGTPIYAMANGVVSHAAYAGGYGNRIDIKHQGDVVSRYAHLDSMAVRVGQQVQRGVEIGKSGETGIGTGPHLHVDLFKGARNLQPGDLGLLDCSRRGVFTK
ncbi:peptidoglycan DD-metalloendopeptidase family protein [Leptolyngbya sp. DQ-M1]|uniref:peptidoglycan DD-metalloendopeptidase family protein n=1 Tax=Leptolyngbya sp. DQ-M1 TaxID=2933920 RepID=UPI00329A7A11